MRHAVLLLCSVLLGGTLAVAQAAPAASSATAPTQSAVPQTASAQALPAPPPLHPITDAQAREILKLTHADALRNQVMARMLITLQRLLPPYMPHDVTSDLLTSLQNVDMDSMVVKIYQEHISEKDAAAIIAFYKTPAGQHLLTELPTITRESQEAGAEAGRKAAQQVLERHKAEILAAAKKYKAMHAMSSQPQN